MQRLRTLLRWLRPIGWLALLAGLVLQLWVKDRLALLMPFFYAMPKPCLAVLALVLALASSGLWKRIVAGAVTLVLLVWWLSLSWSSGPPPPAGPAAPCPTNDEITLLYWNLCRPKGLDPHAVEMVRELRPQIAAFVEPGPEIAHLLPAYEAALPGYKVAWMPRGILWLSRLNSRYRERGRLDETGAFARFEVYEPGPAFPVVIADVHPYIFKPRERQLQELLGHARDRADVILAGDFNTPFESVHFDAWRTLFTHAFSAAGTGFRETWPAGLPLLSIDHIWVGKAWEVLEARKLWRLAGSDHAALFVRLRRQP